MKSNKNLSSSIVCCGFRQLHISFYTVSSHFDSGWKNAGSTKTLKDPLLIFVFPSGIDANLRVLGEKIDIQFTTKTIISGSPKFYAK